MGQHLFHKHLLVLVLCVSQSNAVGKGSDAGEAAVVALSAGGSMVSQKPLVRREGPPAPRIHLAIGHALGMNALEAEAVGRDDEDCDRTSLTTTTTTSTAVSPSSFRWRVVMTTPCRSDQEAHLWEMHAVDFHAVPCANASVASIMTPFEVVTSGDVSARYNKHLAFDGDMTTAWRGQEDERGRVWLLAAFNYSASVKCVRFFQCACLRSARQVTLEAETDWSSLDWRPVSLQSDVEFGEWTQMQV